jgi:HK97 gp10 family phage protein
LISVRLEGAKQLVRALEELPKAVRGKPVLFAVRKSAQPVVEQWKQNAPKDTGEYAESIGIVKAEHEGVEGATVHAGPRRGKRFPHAYLGIFHEWGTSKMPSHPHARPAWESKGPEACKSLVSILSKAVNRAARRLARRARA